MTNFIQLLLVLVVPRRFLTDTSPPWFAACNLLISGGFHCLYPVMYRHMKVPSMRKYGERTADQS